MKITSHPKIVAALAAGALVVGTGTAATVLSVGSSDASEETTSQSTEKKTSTATIERGDLTEQKESAGNVTTGEPWTAAIEPEGVVTKRLDKGTAVSSGETLVWVANKPVVLATGETPLYRNLELTSKRLEGDDVTQLQQFLLDQGHNDKKRLTADGKFGVSTQRAVKAWQKEMGREQSGIVDRTQLLFHPSSLRIENEPQVGSQFAELSVSGSEQTVTANFDTKSRDYVANGATVTLEVDESTSIEGTVTDVDTTVGDDGSKKLEVTITPGQSLPDGVERVTVVASRELATGVLTIPVNAIVALAGGGYAVEVETDAGPELREVELGQVVDDRAEISGDFDEGDEVVVPVDLLEDDDS